MASASTSQPSPNEPENRATALISMFSVWSVVAIGFMGARVWSRLAQHHLGIDDFCMLVATVTFVTFSILIIIMSVHGGFQHLYYVDKSSLPYILKLNYIAQPINTMSEAFGKISIAFLLLRIMGMTQKRKEWSLYIIIVMTTAIGIITSFLTFFQCKDPRALWDKADFGNVECWNPLVETRWALFTSSWFTFVDFFLALFPILVVWKLQMSLKKKVAICVLLGLGTTTGILSGLKTQQIYALSQRTDGLWTSYLLYAFAGGEVFLMITLGSIPTIRNFYDKITGLATGTKIYISLRRLVTRGSRSRLDENETRSKETNAIDQEHGSKGSKGSKESKKSKASKTKAPHPLDIPPSLLYSNGIDTTTSIHGGNEDDSQRTGSRENVNRPSNNEVKVVQSFEIV